MAQYMTKAEWAYSEIKSMIMSGEFRAGARLLTSALAQTLDVSDTPVREALRMLERDGYVTIRRHAGATVAQVAWHRAYEVVAVRMYLEVLAIRESTPLHTAVTLAPVAELLDDMEECIERGEATRFSELNRQFHTALYLPCPNTTLREEIQALWDRLWMTRSHSFFQFRSVRMSEAHVEHHALIGAIREGDVERAAAVATEHRSKTLETWSEIIKDQPVQPDLETAG